MVVIKTFSIITSSNTPHHPPLPPPHCSTVSYPVLPAVGTHAIAGNQFTAISAFLTFFYDLLLNQSEFKCIMITLPLAEIL